MEYILHIGMPKTGSTSLQHALLNNQETLHQHGIVFPETGINRTACGQVRHHNLFMAFRNNNHNYIRNLEYFKKCFRWETVDENICVISDENLFALPNPELLLSLFPRDRTRIVVYLREPVEYVTSLYANQIRWGTLKKTFQNFSIDKPSPFFEFFLKKWRLIYGQENLVVRHYDRNTLLDGNVVADFLDLVRPELNDILPIRKYELHASISGNLLFTKYILNNFIDAHQSHSIVKELTKLAHLDPDFCGRFYVDQETVIRIANRVRKDCKAVNKHFGLSLRPRREPIEGSACPDRDKFAQDYSRIRNEAQEMGGNLAPLLKSHNDEILRLASVLNPVA